MPLAETPADPKAMPDFLRLVGAELWTKRLSDLGRRAQASAFQGRATQHRHALEFALARAARDAGGEVAFLPAATVPERFLRPQKHGAFPGRRHPPGRIAISASPRRHGTVMAG